MILCISQIAHCNQVERFILDAINNSAKLEQVAQCALPSPVLYKIAFSQQIINTKPQDQKLDLQEVIDFVDRNPNWPTIDRVKIGAEYCMNKNSDLKLLKWWFTHNKPITAHGHKIQMYFLLHNTKNVQQVVKNGWIYGEFDANEQQEFLKRYGSHISQQDHHQKIFESLIDGRVESARRIFPLIDKDSAKIYDLYMNLDAKSTITMQTQHRSNPSLVYLYLRYITKYKKEITKDDLLALYKHFPSSRVNDDKLDQIRSFYVREMIDCKLYKQAYDLSTTHECQDLTKHVQSSWLSGWIALRFLKRPQEALNHFKKAHEMSIRSGTLSRNAYWIARCYDALHKKEDASKWYHQAAEQGHTFYGQVAQLRLGYKDVVLPKEFKPTTGNSLANFEDEVHAVDILLRNKVYHLAIAYIKNLVRTNYDKNTISMIFELLERNNAPIWLKVETAQRVGDHGVFMLQQEFPTHIKIKKPILSQYIIYSVIKRESSFNPQSVAIDDDSGLMQIIPSTAQRTAKSLGIKYDQSRLTKDPDYNILIGSKHLYDNIKEYNNIMLSIMAYNAGAHRVNRWIARNGDPRKIKNFDDVIDWIELVPFPTTRQYFQKMASEMQIYYKVFGGHKIILGEICLGKHQ